MARIIAAGVQFVDANGTPVSGGKLYTYDTGTTTPKSTYSDKARTSANANPIRLNDQGYPADAAGAGGNYIAVFGDADGTDYRLKLDTSADVNIFTDDEVPNPTDEKIRVGFNWTNMPGTNDEVSYVVTQGCSLPASLTDSQGYCLTTATDADADFDIQKNGSSIGTATFATATNAVSFTFASETSFVAGDRLSVEAPGTQDSTLADIAVTLVATVD